MSNSVLSFSENGHVQQVILLPAAPLSTKTTLLSFHASSTNREKVESSYFLTFQK